LGREDTAGPGVAKKKFFEGEAATESSSRNEEGLGSMKEQGREKIDGDLAETRGGRSIRGVVPEEIKRCERCRSAIRRREIPGKEKRTMTEERRKIRDSLNLRRPTRKGSAYSISKVSCFITSKEKRETKQSREERGHYKPSK